MDTIGPCNHRKKIRMKAPHALAGRVLREYLGTITDTLELPGGVTVTIKPGDYIAFCACMPKEWLDENPNLWETCN